MPVLHSILNADIWAYATRKLTSFRKLSPVLEYDRVAPAENTWFEVCDLENVTIHSVIFYVIDSLDNKNMRIKITADDDAAYEVVQTNCEGAGTYYYINKKKDGVGYDIGTVEVLLGKETPMDFEAFKIEIQTTTLGLDEHHGRVLYGILA